MKITKKVSFSPRMQDHMIGVGGLYFDEFNPNMEECDVGRD